MNLKEMQLVGFKSFADKTTISFQDGVTCIVGPNGCGKSNVADAVRWVLGEQSAKSLRGSNMQDVIFNGTQKRRSTSFCEVTLTFDNSSKLFDVEYGEVAISRRLYRNGDSEYLLNKQNCRLKDIVALLHGVGIGKEGYSIIGQGKVAQIMNSKPEDRRAIFEEATGIMSQKQRKQEIERKIAASEDNLAIYRQRMNETERQLAPLAKQAETAKQYFVFAEELKYHEVNAYVYRHENAETEKAKYTDIAADLTSQIEKCTAEIERITLEREKNRIALDAADGRIAALNSELLTYTVGNTEKSGNARLFAERADGYREKMKDCDEDIRSCEERILEIAEELKACEETLRLQTARSEQIRKESQELFDKMKRLDGEIAVYEQEFAQNRVKELSSFEDLAQLKENRGSLAAWQDAVTERINEVNVALDKEETRKKTLVTDIAECGKKIAELSGMVSSADGVLAEQTRKIESKRGEYDEVNGKIYDATARIQSVEHSRNVYIGLKNRFEGYKDSVRRLLQAAQTDGEVNKRIRGMIADIVRCEEKYELAIETIFGGAMQNIVTATSEHAKDLIAYLKKHNLGVVTFLPVDAMKPRYNTRDAERALDEAGAIGLADQIVQYDEYYAPVIRNLLGNTLVCDNTDNAVKIARKYSHSFRIVTLDGDVIATSGAMTGGSRKKDAGNLLQNERMIQQCDEEIAKVEKELSSLRSLLVKTNEERIQAEADLEGLREKFQTAATDLATVKQQEAALQQSLGEVEQNITDYHNAINTLVQRQNSLTDEAELSSETEKTLAGIREKADAESAQKHAECDALKAERQGYATKYSDLQIEGVEVDGSVTAAEADSKRLNGEREDLKVTIEQKTEEREGHAREITKWEREAEKQALTKEEQEKVASLRAQIEETSEDKQKINARQIELETAQNGLQDKITDHTTRRGKCEVEVSRIETTLENFRQRIEEAYEMTYEDCLPLRDGNYDIVSSAGEIAGLKRKINALGPINYNAVADYDEIKARYDEMVIQRDDVQNAILSANEMLEEIKADMRARFDEGFTVINENFMRIFRELFGGGSAKLELNYENCEDPLDAGVDILASPPGKMVKNISSLSGGEQALTAIAILFAILKTNPMPFCILDEIEAALDDANIGRFASYLKKFSKETQFVVITHRKPTMNQADTLFGVTMEEQGISKIVSVKLSEVESRLGKDTVQD